MAKKPEQIMYTAFFVEKEKLREALDQVRTSGFDGLEKPIEFPHVTTKYRPEQVDMLLLGSKVTMFLDGYGVNDENEGFRVSLQSDDPKLQAEIDRISEEGSVPHITTSISAEGKAVNTRYVDFQPIEPIMIEGTFGGFTNKHRVMDTPPTPRAERPLPDISGVETEAPQADSSYSI